MKLLDFSPESHVSFFGVAVACAVVALVLALFNQLPPPPRHGVPV